MIRNPLFPIALSLAGVAFAAWAEVDYWVFGFVCASAGWCIGLAYAVMLYKGVDRG